MLKIENLSCQALQADRAAPLVIDNLNLEAREGEILVVLGNSGSGKTTLLYAIAGLLPLASGQISHNAISFVGLAPNRRDVSLVFQAGNHYDHWTLGKHIDRDLKAAGLAASARSAKSAEILHRVGLQSLANRYPHQCSGGQLQRLAIARCEAGQKSIVLLDEPLVHLDNASKRPLLDLIRQMATSDRTLIYVTHDINDAMQLADKIAILSNGMIVQIDAPKSIYQQPCSLAVGNLLSLTPLQVIRPQDLQPEQSVALKSYFSARYNAARCWDDRWLIAIRPEAIKLLPPESFNGQSHTNDIDSTALFIRGVVNQSRWLGAMQLVSIRVDQLGLLIDTLQPAMSEQSSFEAGQQVICRLTFEDMHCMTEGDIGLSQV